MGRRTGTRARILELVQRFPTAGVAELARTLGVTESAVRQHLQRLEIAVPGQWKARRRFPPAPSGPNPSAPAGSHLGREARSSKTRSEAQTRRHRSQSLARVSRRVLFYFDRVTHILSGPLGENGEAAAMVRAQAFSILWYDALAANDPWERFVFARAAWLLSQMNQSTGSHPPNEYESESTRKQRRELEELFGEPKRAGTSAEQEGVRTIKPPQPAYAGNPPTDASGTRTDATRGIAADGLSSVSTDGAPVSRRRSAPGPDR